MRKSKFGATQSEEQLFMFLMLGVVGLIVMVVLYFVGKGSGSSFTQTSSSSSSNTEDDADTDTESEDNTVYIFYAPWCGHCKRSMNDFERASTNPGTNIILVNSDDSGSKSLMARYGVNSFPRIVRSDNTVYNGNRVAQDIIRFAMGG